MPAVARTAVQHIFSFDLSGEEHTVPVERHQRVGHTDKGFEIFAPGLPAHGGINIAEALNVASAANLAEMGYYSKSAEAFFWLAQITRLSSLSYLSNEEASKIL